jgi:FtsH-binding integral membrane protein
MYLEDGYHREVAAYAPENARVGFIRRTYLHLAGSVAALVGIEALLLESEAGLEVLKAMYGNKLSLLLCLAIFIGGGMFARYMARANSGVAIKYLGLALYVALWAVMLLPILYVAIHSPQFGMAVVNQAALLTLVVFAGLTLTVFVTKADFSGLGIYLFAASWAILAVIVAGILFGFGLGLWISFLCIALAAGYILYDTSNILHRYRTNEHVAAALELFADVALLFYHILRVLMLSRND